MWPRLAEIVIGLWLLTTPWILSEEPQLRAPQISDCLCGAAIVLLSLISFWPVWRKAHLAEIPIGLWVLGFAYLRSTHPAPAVIQSELLAALFLLNFAIIPSPANLPPLSWRNLSFESRA
jgi:hypothetical protein